MQKKYYIATILVLLAIAGILEYRQQSTPGIQQLRQSDFNTSSPQPLIKLNEDQTKIDYITEKANQILANTQTSNFKIQTDGTNPADLVLEARLEIKENTKSLVIIFRPQILEYGKNGYNDAVDAIVKATQPNSFTASISGFAITAEEIFLILNSKSLSILTYTNKKFGYSIKYPNIVFMKESDEGRHISLLGLGDFDIGIQILDGTLDPKNLQTIGGTVEDPKKIQINGLTAYNYGDGDACWSSAKYAIAIPNKNSHLIFSITTGCEFEDPQHLNKYIPESKILTEKQAFQILESLEFN